MTRKKNAGTLLDTAQKDDRLETLKRLRDEVCDCIDQTVSARDVASLTNSLVKILEQIDELEGSPSAKKRQGAEVTPIEVLFSKQPKRRKPAAL